MELRRDCDNDKFRLTVLQGNVQIIICAATIRALECFAQLLLRIDGCHKMKIGVLAECARMRVHIFSRIELEVVPHPDLTQTYYQDLNSHCAFISWAESALADALLSGEVTHMRVQREE